MSDASPSTALRTSDEELPRSLVAAVLVLAPIPYVLESFGIFIDPGSSAGLVHSLLEWSSVCVALCTFGLGVLAWNARPDPLLFIITLAALLSGISDSHHMMTTSGLLGYSGRFEDYVQWSGAVGRFLWALVLTLGAIYLLCFHHENRPFSWRRLAFITLPAVVGTVALQWSSLLETFPAATLPGTVARKPWDAPLFILILVSTFIYFPVIRQRESLLAKSIPLANAPLVAAGMYYVFGFSSLYDAGYFNAHILKILTGVVPLTAVALHLARSYRREVAMVDSMRNLVRSLEVAEDELRSKEVRLNQLTQNIKEVFWITTPDGSRIHYVSPAYQDIFGLTEESLYESPRSFLEVVHPDDRQRIDLSAERRKSDFEVDYRILRPDGETRWLRTRGFPIKNETGVVYRLAGVTEDVTDRKRTEEDLRRSESRTRALLRAMPDLMFRMSRAGIFVDFYSPPGFKLYRPPSIFLGAPVRKVLGESLGEMFESSIERALSTGVVQTLEYRLPPDGRAGEFEARFAPSSDGEVLVVVRDVTEQKRLQREILEVSNREQEHFGHDLHDGIAQQLMGIALLSKVLQKRLEKESRPEAADASQIEKLVEDALAQTRSLARGLAPVEIDAGGLEAALEELARRVEGIHGVRCVFRGGPTPATEARAVALHLYRIAQEAVSNALRHASAKRILIELSCSNGLRRLTVRDDGVGIETETGYAPRNGDGGMGLHIMRYRARMIDAVLEVRPAPGKGTIVFCEWSETPELAARQVHES